MEAFGDYANRQAFKGTGKRMRHVKLRPGEAPDAAVLTALVESAYRDMRARLRAGAQ